MIDMTGITPEPVPSNPILGLEQKASSRATGLLHFKMRCFFVLP